MTCLDLPKGELGRGYAVRWVMAGCKAVAERVVGITRERKGGWGKGGRDRKIGEGVGIMGMY